MEIIILNCGFSCRNFHCCCDACLQMQPVRHQTSHLQANDTHLWPFRAIAEEGDMWDHRSWSPECCCHQAKFQSVRLWAVKPLLTLGCGGGKGNIYCMAPRWLTLKKPSGCGVSIMAQRKLIWLVAMRMQFCSLASLSVLRIWCCPELWCRLQNSALLCLWHRPEATGPIQSLVQELPHSMGMTLKTKQTKPDGFYGKVFKDKGRGLQV